MGKKLGMGGRRPISGNGKEIVVSEGLPPRAVVISNCQAQPLKHTLSLLCKGLLFDNLSVHLLGHDRDREIADFVSRAQAQYDIVVSVGLSDDWGPLAADRIRDTFAGKAVTLISNLYYTGLHPDIVYIGGMSQRLPGPLGDYHSRVALTGFLRGLPVETIRQMYTASIYERLGFFQAHAHSIAELTSREERHDVTVVPLIESMLRDRPLFMSVNHPTSHLIWAYGQKIARHLADHHAVRLSHWAGGPDQMVNHLGNASVFPVYPEIGAYLGVTYPTSYSFKPDTFHDAPVMTLDLHEFVDAEMAAFSSIPFEELSCSHQGIEILEHQAHLDLSL
jgi:hypothetical protein